MNTSVVAPRLREIAAYLVLEGDRYRARAYQKAAGSVEAIKNLEQLIAERRLTSLPGIGESLAGAIEELARRGTTDLLERLRAHWPALVVDIADLGGLRPARALALHAALSPADLDDLAEMCRTGRVRQLAGFGAAIEARLLDGIERRQERGEVVALADARQLTAALAAHLASGAAAQASPAGAARRWVELSERLVLAAASREPDALADHLGSHPLVASVERAPATDSMIRFAARLTGGVQCDLVVAPPERYGTALALATGAEAHVELLRRRAAAAGLTLDAIAAADEEALYRALGLPWLPPEVRDGTDELAAADAGEDFASLVALADVIGSVHCHTTYSDGKHTVEQMARAARALGHSYITITDHSPSAQYAGGVTVDRLGMQWAEIAEVEKRVDIRILRGTESDIRADGSLDYPDDVLASMDVVIASIHQRFKLDEEAMTRRLVAAMRQPLFKIWGHALGRLIQRRDPIKCRFDEVLDAIAEGPAAIEINGDPRRLDLEPERARQALARGARFVLSSDAHSTEALANVEFAVAQARRARLRRGDVLNTLPADEFCRAVRPLPE
ncbi:MAG TPA: PHP domain-containing protein [Kofleriaceae bacterium]|nr:PHP domain-containing protein [Kofleriaceae bacterium]